MPLSTIQSSTTLAHRNMIINGDLMIDQKAEVAQQTGSGGKRPIDGWRTGQSNVSELFTETFRSTDAPANTGLNRSLKMQIKTPETALASNEDLTISTKIEGHNCQQLMYGTANAKTTTLSFWVKSSIVGTFAARIYQADGNDNISKPYTINVANTWEYKTITYPGNTLAAITDDATEGLHITWYLATGSDSLGGSNGDVWHDLVSNKVAFGHVTNTHITTDESTFQLTGVQFEIGHVATPFEFRTFNEALAKCQRYYYRINAIGSSDERKTGFSRTTTNCWADYTMPVTMNHAPTLETSGNAAHYAINIDNTTVACSVVPAINSSGVESVMVQWVVASGLTMGEANGLRFANANAFLAFEAEL